MFGIEDSPIFDMGTDDFSGTKESADPDLMETILFIQKSPSVKGKNKGREECV